MDREPLIVQMNWRALICDLTNRKRGGVTQSCLATLCGCVQSTISALANGEISCPNANLGLRIMALHKAMSEGAALPDLCRDRLVKTDSSRKGRRSRNK
ncbi:hypothetical protein BDI4_660010 [Burkholderia diffusa]|nr:hypothetical protein BDI4_660010 [Burkholderia diffusa]